MTSEALVQCWWIGGRVGRISDDCASRVFQNKYSGYPGCACLKTNTVYLQNLTHDCSNNWYHLTHSSISCWSPLNAKKKKKKPQSISVSFQVSSRIGVLEWALYVCQGKANLQCCINNIPSGILGRQEEVRATPRLEGGLQSFLQQHKD